jgi:hypothetical protein
MAQNRKPRRLGTGRASECVAWTADASTHTENALARQSARILRRFNVSPALALTIAELAYDHRRPA